MLPKAITPELLRRARQCQGGSEDPKVQDASLHQTQMQYEELLQTYSRLLIHCLEAELTADVIRFQRDSSKYVIIYY